MVDLMAVRGLGCPSLDRGETGKVSAAARTALGC